MAPDSSSTATHDAQASTTSRKNFSVPIVSGASIKSPGSFGLINSKRDERCSDGHDAFADERELEFSFSVKADDLVITL
jgi:hypothetical protein